MPQVFKIGAYTIFFWIGEGNPLEPVHVHISEGVPTANATKIWITKSGKALLANNSSHIQLSDLRRLMRIIEANSDTVCSMWIKYFGSITYFC